MLRNIPNQYTAWMVEEMLDQEGYKAKYDFLYLPFRWPGYAFVNFVSPLVARQASESFKGFKKWAIPSKKCGEVAWSKPHQGLEEHIERYRNSPVMHEQMPEEYKPKLFKNGKQVPFPAPTKTIKPPKLRPMWISPTATPGPSSR